MTSASAKPDFRDEADTTSSTALTNQTGTDQSNGDNQSNGDSRLFTRFDQSLPDGLRVPLSDWPIKRRSDWLDWLNAPQTAAEEAAIQRSIRESRPYGSAAWMSTFMNRLGWQEPRKPGRPRKKKR